MPSPGRVADQNHKERLRGWNSENLGKRCLNFFWTEVAESKELRRSASLVNSSATNRERTPDAKKGPQRIPTGPAQFHRKDMYITSLLVICKWALDKLFLKSLENFDECRMFHNPPQALSPRNRDINHLRSGPESSQFQVSVSPMKRLLSLISEVPARLWLGRGGSNTLPIPPPLLPRLGGSFLPRTMLLGGLSG